MKTYDVIVVGAGPAGIMATYQLSRAGLDVLLIDKGEKIKRRHCPALEKGIKCAKCPTCHLISGFGGAGLFSDGKIILSDKIGGNLKITQNDYSEIEAFIKKFHRNAVVKDTYSSELKVIAEVYGLEYIPEKIIHLGTDGGRLMLERVYKWFQDNKNITMKFNTKVKWFKKNKGKYIVMADKAYIANKLVIAPGRDGSVWLADNLGQLNEIKRIDIGVRVEVPNKVFTDLIDAHEVKLLYTTKQFNDKVRTFCMNPGGYVIQEYSNGYVTVNGFSYSDPAKNSGLTNLALLVSVNFTTPFNNAYDYGKSIMKMSNQLANGTVLVQRYGDMKKFRRTTYERLLKNKIQPTLKVAAPGDLSYAIPHRILTDIKEMIEILDKIFPGFAADETLVYGTEVKFYTAKNEKDDIYIIGDGSGKTRGIFQSFVAGLKIAKQILDEEV